MLGCKGLTSSMIHHRTDARQNGIYSSGRYSKLFLTPPPLPRSDNYLNSPNFFDSQTRRQVVRITKLVNNIVRDIAVIQLPIVRHIHVHVYPTKTVKATWKTELALTHQEWKIWRVAVNCKNIQTGFKIINRIKTNCRLNIHNQILYLTNLPLSTFFFQIFYCQNDRVYFHNTIKWSVLKHNRTVV